VNAFKIKSNKHIIKPNTPLTHYFNKSDSLPACSTTLWQTD